MQPRRTTMHSHGPRTRRPSEGEVINQFKIRMRNSFFFCFISFRKLDDCFCCAHRLNIRIISTAEQWNGEIICRIKQTEAETQSSILFNWIRDGDENEKDELRSFVSELFFGCSYLALATAECRTWGLLNEYHWVKLRWKGSEKQSTEMNDAIGDNC